MSHVPFTSIHRFVGDPFTLRITVTGLTVQQVTTAVWSAGPVTKTLVSGISAEDDAGTAVLLVDVTAADTTAMKVGKHAWQASAGGSEPPVVANGTLELSARFVP